jgi:hypothetical protein
VPIRHLAVALAATIAAGCFHKTWESAVVQPELVLGGNQVQRTSYPLVIKMSDMDLPKFCRSLVLAPGRTLGVSCEDMDLFNTAYFVIVSKDRMRFHVTLNHKWETMSDPNRWEAWIEDDSGRRYNPEGVDRRRLRPVTRMWGTDASNDRLPPPLYALTIWRGDGDYVFYAHDLFRRGMKRVSLVLRRPGYTYRYVWSFVDARGQRPATADRRTRVRRGARAAAAPRSQR